jgi:hypothetical protein
MTGQLNISAGGLLVTGNVGIGTSSPAEKLEVNGANTSIAAYNNSILAGSGFTRLKLGLSTNYNAGLSAYVASGQPGVDRVSLGFHVTTFTSSLQTFYEAMTITDAGRVGIGTTSPGDRLEVLGGRIKIASDSNGYGWIYGLDTNHSIIMRGNRDGTVADYTHYHQFGGSSTGHHFWTGGALASQTERFRITNDYTSFLTGNVGIGTTSPASLLDVRGSLIVNGTGVVNGASLTAIRTDLSSSLSVGYFGTGSQGLFIKNDSSDSKYMQLYSSGNTAGGYRFYVGNTLAFQLDTGAGATFYGSGSFASSVMCYKSTQSSANGDPLGDLDGYGGSSYDGFYAVSRPGYSSFVMQFNPGGSVGTVQFAGSYASAMYRRNKTDNTTWSSWRQVD